MQVSKSYKKSLFLLILSFQFITFLFSSSLLAAEKSVIIVYKEKPGNVEAGKIKSHKGKIKRIHPHIKAISATIEEEEIFKLKNDPSVSYIEDDIKLSLITPVSGEEYLASWGVERIGSANAHEAGIRGSGVKIAVLDTGIDYMHEEFVGSYKGGYDFVFEDDDPYDDGYNSHGTHVSGIIAAALNGSGVVGVAPEASLYAVKVLGGSGFGMLSDILAGIEWSIENEMDVLNLSFGSIFHIQALEDACNYAYENGLLLVAATGNSKGGAVGYPARYSSVIGVSAINIDNNITNMAAIGPEVELVAPGINILSTMAAEKGGYGYLHGSSQAAPHVAGVAALLLSSGNFEDLNGDGIRNKEDVRLTLRKDALDLGEAGFDELYGYGMVRYKGYEIIEEINLTTSKEKKKAINGHDIDLPWGTYRIEIINQDLTFLKTSIAEKIDGNITSKRTLLYNFMKELDKGKIVIELSEKEAHLSFYPLGMEGTSAKIRVLKK